MINAVKIRKYKEAHILILNMWQSFLTIIFYRGKFYHFYMDAFKQGEYDIGEYTVVLDACLKDAKTLIDKIKKERSLLNIIKKFVCQMLKKDTKRNFEKRQAMPAMEKK